MTPEFLLNIPRTTYFDLWCHLLPPRVKVEQVAFVYALNEPKGDTDSFRCVDWYTVPPNGFVSRSRFHVELTDETRALVIKRAHDLQASLVEFHSHVGLEPAHFSASDLLGFQEFVPHVRWRLKGRPYLAVVVAKSGFDGFVWNDGPNAPQHLDGIVVEQKTLRPTKLSSPRGGFF